MSSRLSKMTPIPTDDEILTQAKRIEEAIKARMSAPGALGLPPLLDQRRLRYGIPDEAFEAQAAFNIILMWQIEPLHVQRRVEREGESAIGRIGDTMIIAPESSQKSLKNESPRGVIVSAGLSALDNLRSNGIDLGHIVNFIRLSPWRYVMGNYGGTDQHIMILRDGDIIASEDVRQAIAGKKVDVTWDAESKQHLYVDDKGCTWVPQMPGIDDTF